MTNNKDSDALNTAVRWLAGKSYSVQELCHRLKKGGYTQEDIDKIVNHLSKRGYLNDAALCDLLLNKYYVNGNYSLRGAVARVKQRGIPDIYITAAVKRFDMDIADIDIEYIEYKHALRLVEKKLKHASDLSKVCRYLAAKGFTRATIVRVLTELQKIQK
ncbi:MAG TPA: regulatory protein RecX [Methylomusa anaerophila]|uniref:Regulatory protein RecX n=1 Tax=Methylomusa anaerophila TaxID=1930071 RepID=A0A348APV9_9FIRM|nr:regulatory protein RecX [Methylomusa anaerophila]BBB93107.1 recombination regulator RecX [Methylomusa anaerophila]HML87060.1 regulatory protein RecX [Methylomusa anaerophila]